jgi:Choline dehydrogenase and related flavoproteins
MGGTTVLNGLMYCRGDSSDYDEYEKLGATGWGYKNVLPYFLKSEHNLQYNVSRYTKKFFLFPNLYFILLFFCFI